MRIYENRDDYKRSVFCPTCAKEGHMWMTCPAPARMMDLEKQGKEPDLSLFSEWKQKRLGLRESDGSLYYHAYIFRMMSRAYLKQQARIEKRKALKQATAAINKVKGAPKRKTSCGFCGGNDHNRRNCDVMDSFVDDLHKASVNYRKKFYKRLVQGMGIAEGALVSVSASGTYLRGKYVKDFQGIGIISKIEWDQVNLGLGSCTWDYASKVNVDLIIDGETLTTDKPFVGLVEADLADNGQKGKIAELFGIRNRGWSFTIDNVISPSESVPSEDWFNEGYTECWEWITKNKSLFELNRRLSPIIAIHHPSARGRNAKKFKARLAEYARGKRK